MTLLLVHTRYQLIQTLRIPVAVIGSALFPAAAMLFFIVPSVRSNPVGATDATASMIVFAAMVSNLFGYGVGVADDRASAWDPYTRTLPAGPWPKFGSRFLAGTAMMMVALLPVVVIAAVATPASVTVLQFVLGAGAAILATVPFTLLGLSIGYLLPVKAAMAVVQVIFFPMAFAGGLLSAPDQTPGFVRRIAPFVPTRGAAEMMWAAVGHFDVDLVAVASFAVWSVVFGLIALTAYRRDEGQRYG